MLVKKLKSAIEFILVWLGILIALHLGCTALVYGAYLAVQEGKIFCYPIGVTTLTIILLLVVALLIVRYYDERFFEK